MKPDGMAFLDWLHKRREAKELERQAQGVSEEEWLRRVHIKADEILARLPDREPASVARDRPATKPHPPRRRKP
ncbi:hypothetical protein JXD38_09465 [candidate division WOR-3 bacterium]|nr:hypothetical protein [candidate division WOR-3 bacterium]